MYKLNEISKPLILCILSVFTLFWGFFDNSWGVADQQWFDNFLRGDESMLVGRLVKSRRDGILSSGGLLGVVHNDPLSSGWVTKNLESQQYLAYNENKPFLNYTVYQSQIGGQGMFFSVLDQIISIPYPEKLPLFHALTALFSAIVVASIVFWFYLEFGGTISLFVLVSAIFSQWLVVYGRHLYWAIWAFYLPLAVLLHYFRARSVEEVHLLWYGFLVFITVFLQGLFSGHNFITAILIMVMVPFVYYSIVNKSTPRRLFAGLAMATFSASMALFLCLTILCFQIASVKGSFMAGVQHILFKVEERTTGDPNKTPQENYTETSFTDVLSIYLNGAFFDANNYLSHSDSSPTETGKIHFNSLIVTFLIMSGILLILNIMRTAKDAARIGQKAIALIAVTWLSIMGPLVWFFVFRQQSVIHTHMDFILWQMPFVFFGFAVCGLAVRELYIKFFPATNLNLSH